MSLWLFCWWLWTSLCPVCKVCCKIIFCRFGMFEFSLRQHCFVLALNIVDSPTLVFIPIVPCQFEQVLPNLRSFDQSIVSSSHRNLAKPKKVEKHLPSFVWEPISKLDCVLVGFFCANKNKQYIYIYRYQHLPGYITWRNNLE